MASATPGEPVQSMEGSVMLISEFLGLLRAFVGTKLTLQLVRDIWPELPVHESDFDPGDSE